MSSHKNLNMTLLRAFVSFIAKREKGSMNVEMDSRLLRYDTSDSTDIKSVSLSMYIAPNTDMR